MTPLQYAKRELAAGRFPQITVISVIDVHYLADADTHLLKARGYISRDRAIADRSRILDRARKASGI